MFRYIKVFINDCAKAEIIRSINDCRRVKRWLVKTILLYLIFSAVAILAAIIISNAPTYPEFFGISTELANIVVPILSVLVCWGFATLFMYLPQVLGTVGKTAAKGFEIGDSVKTTHVNVTHEYGDYYKVSSHTESSGCLFALFGGLAGFFLWAVFCVYIGPFINFKKIAISIKNIAKFSS